MDPSTSLVAAHQSSERVDGLTHGIYRYPARFSPTFVRAALAEFTEPNEIVIDPFLGGGTTAVEALARGRRFIGFEVNALSIVLARAKTTPLPRSSQDRLLGWAAGEEATADVESSDDDRLRNAPVEAVTALAPYVTAARLLPDRRERDAAAAVLLDVGQWAVDGRLEPVDSTRIVSRVADRTEALLYGLSQLIREGRASGVPASRIVRRRSIVAGRAQEVARSKQTDRYVGLGAMVLTSPPYPGVHVLYHRWQVRGRTETPLPYWLAGCRDGLGPKHYTMGGRSHTGEEVYWQTIEQAWTATKRLLRPGAVVAQVVAFPRGAAQLDRYCRVMEQAGYAPLRTQAPWEWRDVPNRRWYFRVAPGRGTAQEILLLHRSIG